jgi:two-component system sensor histidine kinase AdeS
VNNRISLARQLSGAMAALAITTVVASTAAFYLVYAVLERLRIVALPPDDYATLGWDVGITLTLCAAGLVSALVVALRLARRIVGPLDAVATVARRIAQGDLTARVRPLGQTHGETAALVTDFNAMADQLQRMSNGVKDWNAQIAHELRTPLTILRGRLQGAKDGVFPLDIELVAGLMKQVDGLTRLVEDLRSVSLADSGRLELTLADVDVAAEVEDMAPVLLAILEPAGFGLELALQPGSVKADPTRLRQAILALVDNARRHAHPCALRIAVDFIDDTVAITVSDLGPGLSLGFEDDAFRQFARGKHTLGEAAGGSGLGLAVVRGIERTHGGDAVYLREADRSLFRIILPSLHRNGFVPPSRSPVRA